MSSPGNELLDQVRAAAVEMLGALTDPDVEQLLAGLGNAPPEWSGHALDAQLLDRIDGAALEEPSRTPAPPPWCDASTR